MKIALTFRVPFLSITNLPIGIIKAEEIKIYLHFHVGQFILCDKGSKFSSWRLSISCGKDGSIFRDYNNFWDILPLQQGAGLKSEDPQWVLILLLQCRTLERALDPLDQFENAESPWGVPWNPFPITFSNHETKFILSRSPHPKAGQRLMVKLRSCMLTTLPFNKLPVSTVMTFRTKECNGRVKNANWFSESCSLSSRKNIGVKMYYLPAHFLNVNVNLLKVQRSRA